MSEHVPKTPDPKPPAPGDLPPGRRWHDMGGLDAAPVDLAEHDYAIWEKRVDALMVLTSAKGLMNVDGLRRAIEDLGPAAYESMSYYERWMASVSRNLVEAGAFTLEELNAKMAEIADRGDTYGEASLAGGGA